MQSFKVSIAMTTYNGEKFIYKQLLSIIQQLDDNDEIIISDNGSNDNTVKIINEFQDRRIRLLHNPIKGVIKNFENALKHVTGDIIFLSDQDDLWMPGKVEIVKEKLQQVDLVVSDCMIIDENENVVENSLYAIRKSGTGLIKNLGANTYVGCCMAFKKKVLDVALPFPKDIPMHDIWLGFIADIFFDSCFITEKLVLYRRHQKNISSTTGKSKFNLSQKIKFRMQILKYLPLLIARKWTAKPDN